MSGRITVLLLVLFAPALQAQDEQQAVADVVVIVDTSTSMREAGMDPERSSLLVAKLTWQAGAGRTRTETELTAWIGKRGAAGRLPPHGFPKSNRFG